MNAVGALNYILSRILPFVPRPIVRRVSRRYIAGDDLRSALDVVQRLNGDGFMATLDVLGESVSQPSLVAGSVNEYVAGLAAIDRMRLDSNISVKPTQLGLQLDFDLCMESMRRLVREAGRLGNFVRIDMEDSGCTTATLNLYRQLRDEGLDNVGVVLQACMRRSLADLRALPEGASVRLCKGIYVEPREIAYRDRWIVNRNFRRLLEEAFDRGCRVGIATHDEAVVWDALDLIERRSVPGTAYEFQMLLGVEERLRRIIRREGHRLRVYVPYGANWYAYSLRRLKENPSIAGHILVGLLRPARD
jgi:proline dehydrogenase